jgi:hypothetical protein
VLDVTEVPVEVLELDLEALSDCDQLFLVYVFHIPHEPRKPQHSVDADWLPIEVDPPDFDIVGHKDIVEAWALECLRLDVDPDDAVVFRVRLGLEEKRVPQLVFTLTEAVVFDLKGLDLNGCVVIEFSVAVAEPKVTEAKGIHPLCVKQVLVWLRDPIELLWLGCGQHNDISLLL